MILRIEEMKNACSKILAAVDSNNLSVLTETLQLKTEGNSLYLSVTNREYFAKVRLDVDTGTEFHATVNANLFLKLVAQMTTDTVELNKIDNALVIRGNGTYKLPLVQDNDKLLELPEIVINNPTVNFVIPSDVLLSILQYNSKEITKISVTKPIHKLYYMDESGAVTFTTGACVNNFKLDQPVKVLLNDRLVKLFKLFKGEKVNFTLGYDAISDEIIQTKVRFSSDDVTITAILSCDDSMLRQFPVNAIRGRADAVYPYSINMNREQLIQTINRLMLFTTGSNGKELVNPNSTFEFK